jgi:hypothetical protein
VAVWYEKLGVPEQAVQILTRPVHPLARFDMTTVNPERRFHDQGRRVLPTIDEVRLGLLHQQAYADDQAADAHNEEG